MLVNPVILASTINFLVNFAIQCSMIFLPLLSARLGASDFQVGLIGAAYGGAFLLSSLYCGYQSDRRGRLGFVRAGLLLCTVAFAAQLLARNPLSLALLRAGVGLSLGVTVAALVAKAFESGADMGRFSSYGSLGWIAGALAAACLKEFNLLFTVSALCCGVGLVPAVLLPGRARPDPKAGTGVRPRLGALIRLRLPIYLAVFLRHLGATAVWTILPLFLVSLGLDRFWVGILWGSNFVTQFIVMRCLERFNPHRVFALGQVLSILVFMAYAVVRNLWLLMAIQVLLGTAWSCLYVGALLLVLRAGEERGTASGIFQATINLCGAVGPLLGGMIAQYLGYRGVMLFAAALGVVGLMVAVPQTWQQAQETPDQVPQK